MARLVRASCFSGLNASVNGPGVWIGAYLRRPAHLDMSTGRLPACRPGDTRRVSKGLTPHLSECLIL
jgi:hypothetical protein